MIGILGKKIGMTRLTMENGEITPVTIIKCTPNQVTQLKNKDKDGYVALVLAADSKKSTSKIKKYGKVKEFKVENLDEFSVGKAITVDIFSEGDTVKITGTSKGKGFQGVVRRWNMSGGPASHGSHFHREPGSVGARAKPGKIHIGKHMAGHMGAETKTIKNKIIFIDKHNNLIGIKGSVPGSVNSYISISKVS